MIRYRANYQSHVYKIANKKTEITRADCIAVSLLISCPMNGDGLSVWQGSSVKSFFFLHRLSSSCVLERIKNMQHLTPNRVGTDEQHLNTLNQVMKTILQ